jgi:hypothetical protein
MTHFEACRNNIKKDFEENQEYFEKVFGLLFLFYE